MDLGLSAWVDIANGFILALVFWGKVWFVVLKHAGMLVSADSFKFSIPHVPSRFNGYVDLVGGLVP